MKKIFTLIVIIGLIVVIGCNTGNSKITIAVVEQGKDRLQTIKEKGVLTIVSANDQPFIHIDHETNKLIGIDADIICNQL